MELEALVLEPRIPVGPRLADVLTSPPWHELSRSSKQTNPSDSYTQAMARPQSVAFWLCRNCRARNASSHIFKASRRQLQISSTPATTPGSLQEISPSIENQSSSSAGLWQALKVHSELTDTLRCSIRGPRLSVLPPLRLTVCFSKPLHPKRNLNRYQWESGECQFQPVVI